MSCCCVGLDICVLCAAGPTCLQIACLRHVTGAIDTALLFSCKSCEPWQHHAIAFHPRMSAQAGVHTEQRVRIANIKSRIMASVRVASCSCLVLRRMDHMHLQLLLQITPLLQVYNTCCNSCCLCCMLSKPCMSIEWFCVVHGYFTASNSCVDL